MLITMCFRIPEKVERRRGHNTDCKSPRAEWRAFEYEVEANGVSYQICQNAFLAVLDINRSKLRRKVTDVDGRKETAEDMKGVHHSRPNRISSETVQKIVEWVEALPAQESHYSKRTVRKYLSSDLTMMQLHRLFCEQFPEHSRSRNSFSKIVSESCKIYFGSVRSDICDN